MTLAGRGELFGYRHEGFWKPADTFKERAELDNDYGRGIRPWAVWEGDRNRPPLSSVVA